MLKQVRKAKAAFHYRVEGRISADDIESLEAEVDPALGDSDGLRFLIELDDFEGWTSLQAALADFRTDLSLDAQTVRVAVVGEKNWERVLTEAGNLFTQSEMRWFERDELSDAWDWVKREAEPKTILYLPSPVTALPHAAEISMRILR